VFLGAGIATLNGRLLSVGLPDLRGAMGFGFDEASWLPTALNMGMMFSGCFVVFLSSWFGPRRILLPCAAIFAGASAVLPFVPNYGAMLALIVVAGITSGTFYSLTMTFVLFSLPKRLIIFGIAAYAADIVFVTNIASLIEGWYIEHLSWHWIFWTAAVVTPSMGILVYFGMPGFSSRLVSELYLRLNLNAVEWAERAHFYAVAAKICAGSSSTKPAPALPSADLPPAAASN
jgi:DHA2 family multidrug resistance protein